MKAGRTSLVPLVKMLSKPEAIDKLDSGDDARALIKAAHAAGGEQLHKADPGRRRRDFYKGSAK